MLTSSSPAYMAGFGGHVATEAVSGALPQGRNSPQRPAFGLYTEQLSGTAFTMPRHENRRSWLYRLRPSADHRPFTRYEGAKGIECRASGPLAPNRLRWDPLCEPAPGTDFIDGLTTAVFNRAPADLEGVAMHLYAANAERLDRVFVSADGELLILPQHGRLDLLTELGRSRSRPVKLR
jgi:homogentisate 1,2-dioxygenase